MTLADALTKVLTLAKMTALTKDEKEACTIVTYYIQGEKDKEQAFAFLKERKDKLEKKREARKAKQTEERETINSC